MFHSFTVIFRRSWQTRKYHVLAHWHGVFFSISVCILGHVIEVKYKSPVSEDKDEGGKGERVSDIRIQMISLIIRESPKLTHQLQDLGIPVNLSIKTWRL